MTLGNTNVAIGVQALTTSQNSDKNIAIGSVAMGAADVSGDENIAIGSEAISSITTGANNVGIGSSTLGGLTTGRRNVGIGVGNAASNALIGDHNVFLGYHAGKSATRTSGSVYIGHNAGQNLSLIHI